MPSRCQTTCQLRIGNNKVSSYKPLPNNQNGYMVASETPTRLGYTQASVATESEHVMQKAKRACLLACACLHSAEPKAAYQCDILCTPERFLTDLEFAHFPPRQVVAITLMQAAEEFAVSYITLQLLSKSSRVCLAKTGMRVPLIVWLATFHKVMSITLLKSR